MSGSTSGARCYVRPPLNKIIAGISKDYSTVLNLTPYEEDMLTAEVAGKAV